MFCTVKLSEQLIRGDVVAWNEELSAFGLASTMSTPLGVLSEDSTLDDELNAYYAPVIFAGIAWAPSSRSIPDQGGEMQVENGKVYVDNSADGAGIIAPLPRGQASRNADTLVMTHIR